ncbi:LysR substrate-binding domain-containing protein [Kribbella sp. NPDC055110]
MNPPHNTIGYPLAFGGSRRARPGPASETDRAVRCVRWCGAVRAGGGAVRASGGVVRAVVWCGGDWRQELVRDAAFRWFRKTGTKPVIAAESDGNEALLALVALGCGTCVVPRLVLESSVVRDQLVELPADLEPLTIGLCARRADLHRPLIAALWDLRP